MMIRNQSKLQMGKRKIEIRNFADIRKARLTLLKLATVIMEAVGMRRHHTIWRVTRLGSINHPWVGVDRARCVLGF